MPSIYSRGPALEVCQTQTCLTAATEIQNFVNFNVDPCDDFYQFACGNFLEHTVVDENNPRSGPFISGDANIINGIASILNGSYEELLSVNLAPDFVEGANYSSEADQRVFNFLKSYYDSCMDTATVEKEGPIPLYPLLGNIDYASSSGLDATEIRTALTIHADSFGLVNLWKTTVAPNPSEAGMNMLALESIKYGYLESLNSSNPEEVANFKTMLTGIADAIFASNNTDYVQAAQKASFKLWAKDEMEARIDRVIQFQAGIFDLLSTLEDVDFSGHIKESTKTIAEIQESYPIVNWEMYFRYFVPSDRDVPTEVVVAILPGYLDELTKLVSSTPLETFRDYLLFQVGLQNAAESGSQIRSIMGIADEDRQATCVGYIRKYWDIPMVRYYAMKFFGGAEKRNQLYQLVSNVHQAWTNRLRRLDWLDDTTRANAEDKIAKIGQWVEYNLNYPDDRTPAELSDYLGPIEFTGSFGSNQLLAKRFVAVRRNFLDVGKPVNRENFAFLPDISLLDMNAFYNSLTNYITILPGLVQSPNYDSNYPAYLNYGNIGATIGHEFTHGFDTQGRLFDGDGRYRDWWTESTTAAFSKKTMCLINQYNNMTVEGPGNTWLHVDGNFTLAENVADNGGIGAAYEAYATYWNSGAEKQMTLPGIDLTPDQLFFVSFARFFCLKTTPEYNEQSLPLDNHSPNSIRVKATLQNSVDFAKAYNCPVGSYMNPKEKCSVW
ncbi:hypothetical protein BX666DRAFT_1918150 [Dichotomocladium elegans]|nr:hypothetical protein BX666DRAFT_1918150 [Dichotomocladium elegans]